MKEKENSVPTSKKKKIVYSVIVAVCALLLIAAIVLTAYFITQNQSQPVLDAPPTGDNTDPPVTGDDGQQDPPVDSKDPSEGNQDPVDPTGGEKVAYVSPIETVKTCSVEYFQVYNNQTLDKWCWHKAVDYAAPAGTDVRAMADGTVKKISISEKLGNLVVVEHAGGVETTYRFVEPVAALKEGDAVKQGQVIAKVAEAYGTEAKDGTHLHLEMTLEGRSVDPTDYIDVTLEEK